MTELNTRTLLLLLAAVWGLYAVGVALIGRLTVRRLTAAWWASSLAFEGSAFLLAASRGVSPDWVSVVLARVLFHGGMIAVLSGVAVLRQDVLPHRRIALLLLPVQVGILGYFIYVQPNGVAEGVAGSLVLAAVAGLCADAFARNTPRHLREPFYGLALLFAVFAVVLVIRAPLLYYYQRGLYYERGDVQQILVILILLLFNTAKTFSFIWALTVESMVDRAVAEEQKRAYALIRDALDSMGDALVLHDAEDRIVLFNDRAAAMYPGGGEMFRVGRRFEDVLREAVARGLAPDAAGREEAFVQERLAKRRQADGKPTYRRLADGRQVEISDQRSRSGGIISVARDVTDLMAKQEALRASETRLRLVTDALPVLIAYIDAQQRYVYVNVRYTEWWCRPREAIIGKTVAQLIGPDAYATASENLQKTLAGEAVAFEAEFDFADGKRRACEMQYVPDRDAEGTVVGLYALVIDISARKATEAQLQQAQKMEAVGQLTGGVAHDFNNLLGVVIGNLELLELEKGLNSHSHELLARTLSAANRGAALTHRLLAFSRQQILQPRALDLTAALFDIADLLRPTLGAAIELKIACEPGLWHCRADAAQLEAAIVNLAINGRDAMPHGGILTIAAENAAFPDSAARPSDALAPGEYVVIAVTDIGAGMSPEVVKRAFDPFFTTKEVGKGTGLGLSMVYGFAVQSAGHVQIDSQIGLGTTVRLYLPRAAGRTPAHAVPGPGQAIPAATAAGRLVLVVEDNEPLRKVSVAALKSLGYRVLEAGDAEAGLALLDAHPDIDILFSDVMLPGGLNGAELAERMRQKRPDLKILLTSGNFAAVQLMEGRRDPGLEYLDKPFRIAELERKLARLSGRV